MVPARTWPIAIAGLSVAVLLPRPVVAQPPPESRSLWHAAAGYDWVAFRDVARGGVPVDGSPVRLAARGPTFLLEHTREGDARLQRLEIMAAVAGAFHLDSPLRSIPASTRDRYWRAEGRYEYRRYLFDDVRVRGLDLGLGVRGSAARTSLSRHLPVDLETQESLTSGAATMIVAARLRRWTHVRLDLEWGNGLTLARISDRHSASPTSARTRWGGGWITDLEVATTVAVTAGTHLTIAWGQGNDGLLSSHHSWTTARRALTVGVAYAR